MHIAKCAIQRLLGVIEMGSCSECEYATVVYYESPCYECVMGFQDAFEQKKYNEP